jgi:hypothetical protein
MQVEAKPGDGHPRRIGMKLRSMGYGERAMGVSAAGLTTSGSRIEYKRSLVGNDGATGAICPATVIFPHSATVINPHCRE